MLGVYENFPQVIHRAKTCTSNLSKRKLQQRIAEIFEEVNREAFSFESICSPPMRETTVIIEFGIADDNGFNFLNEEEARRLQNALVDEPMHVMDWFCALRYYRNVKLKKSALKFDYYMLRMIFGEKGTIEFQVFHERGPRYVSPEDLTEFIFRRINREAKKKVLKHTRDEN